jgi:predicted phage terminase large subunit-like protein
MDMPGAIDKAEISWIAPSYTIAADIWRDLKRATTDAWIEKNEIEKRIILLNGGSVRVRSADNPDSLRGTGVDGMVIDEAAFVMEAAWSEVLRPQLVDRGGWCMMLSTPNGKNWWYDLHRQAQGREGWMTWQRPSSDNPLVTAEELEQAKLDMGPRAFAQEHEASFESIEGAEFDGAYFTDSIWFDAWPETVNRVMAIDPSKGATDKSDYSAIVMLGETAKGLYVDADIERRDISRICDDAVRWMKTFDCRTLGLETDQYEACRLLMERWLDDAGLLRGTWKLNDNDNKRVRIRRLTPLLSRGRLKFKRNSRGAKLLVNQLLEFPVGKHDDGPDALEMAVRLLELVKQGRTARREPVEEGVYA